MSAETTVPDVVISAQARNQLDAFPSRHSRESGGPVTFARYPKYKNSGVEWLGEVPGHWEVVQSRRYFSQRKERAAEGDRQLTASQKYGVLYQDEFTQIEDQKVVQVILGAEILKHVEPNDFVISMRSFQGGIEWCAYQGSISSAYVVLIPTAQIDTRFFRYLFKSVPYIQALQTTTNLVRDGQALRFSNFAQINLPLMPLGEQFAIATFLDRETAKIDVLIAEQEKLITLLKEKRQALISHAVTNGLDPNAPMKDSGIEWLGRVPAHWEVRAIKHTVATPVTDGPHETPEFLDDGVPFVSAEAVSDGNLNFEKIRGYISREDHERYALKYRPRKGDIYMVKSGATTGVTAIVDTDDEFNIWSPLAAIRCNSKVRPRYLLHYMRSRNFLDAITLGWSFGTQQNIGMNVIENLAVPVPPTSEQDEIQVTLDNAEALSESLIAEAARAITLLKERRSALISAAVTGKIDVRNA